MPPGFVFPICGGHMERSHKPLCIGVTYMVQQHRLNFLVTQRIIRMSAVPACYLEHCCRPAGWYHIDYPRRRLSGCGM